MKQEWVKFDRATMNPSWIFSHSGNFYGGAGTADNNLSWSGPRDMSSVLK